MKIVPVFFQFIPVLVFTRCIHQQIIKNQTMIPIDDSTMHTQRLLQGLGSGPIRIHYEYDTNDINENDGLGKNIKKIMEILSTFWSTTIQVDYFPSLSFNVPNNFDKNNIKCLTFEVPRRLVDNPTPNKDFGFLVEAKDDGDSGVTAYSYPCAFSKTNGKPMWGLVHWNKQYMTFDPLSFQENIHIGIHQMLHVLGFSQMLYPKYANPNVYQTLSTGAYLTGPYLRQALIQQYGCLDPPGMLLQSGGGQGTALSHWSRKAASNELMTAGVAVNNPTISYITLALLEETGWYKKIHKNNGKYINFGFRKGCGILQTSNCSSNQYCKVVNQKKADFDGTALGYCKNDSLSQCLYIKYYINFICTDPNYVTKSLHADQGVINRTGEKGGEKSRCYSSDLKKAGTNNTKYNFRCYETMCSPTGRTLTIRVGNSFAFCLYPNQQVRVQGFDGTLKCPQSFLAICRVKRCPKECSGNGVCLDGKCLCGDNYNGQQCSRLSSQGFASKAQLFLPSENDNCMIGSYRDSFGYCRLCRVRGCGKCTSKQCLVCLNGSLPNGQSCL